MPGIKDKVAIIGMGCTKFGERWDAGTDDLIIEAAYEAFADAGVTRNDIKAGWVGTVASGVRGNMLSAPLRLDYVPVTRLENACASGTDAFRNAAYAVAAGACDMALAVGVEKTKDTGFSGLPVIRPLGTEVEPPVPPPAQFALAATRYFHKYGLSGEEGKRVLAKIAVKNHHNGTLSPKAHFRREVSEDAVVNAPMIAWPLGLYDCCGVSDGAAAAIIVNADIARKYREDYILVKGLGLACGAKQGTMRDDCYAGF